MVNQIFIIIILLIFLSFECFCLGKRLAQTNSLFINNESAIWVLGIISYFGITFLSFFPFVWLNISIVYFIIIFIIKDLLIFSYIFLWKDRILLKSIKFKNLFFNMLFSILILLIFNLVLYNPSNDLEINFNFYNQFTKIWLKTQEVFGKVLLIDLIIIKQWLFGLIGASVIWSVIHSLMIRFGKKQSLFEYCLSFCLAILLIFFFNFKLNLISLFPVYLVMFGLFLALNIVQFSRKRYSFVFIVNFLVAWIINYHVFIALACTALTTALIYSIMKKPMPALFWIQLLTPIIVVIVSLTNNFSLILTFILILIVLLLYCTLIFLGKNKALFNIDKLISKYSKVMFIWNILIILTLATILTFFAPINLNLIVREKNLIFDLNFIKLTEKSADILEFIQWGIYVLTIIFLFVIILFWKRNNYKFVGMRIVVLIILSSFILMFNPVFNTILVWLKLQNNFTYLRAITFMPLICFGVIWTHNWIIKKNLIST